ncbi:hypothetical protein EMIT053CA3_70192 [Pseudomonas donghuensis]
MTARASCLLPTLLRITSAITIAGSSALRELPVAATLRLTFALAPRGIQNVWDGPLRVSS